jgi:hypothetical protein
VNNQNPIKSKLACADLPVDQHFLGGLGIAVQTENRANVVLALGSYSAHELAHKTGGLPDELYIPADNNANLMTVDSAADQNINIYADWQNPIVQGFAKLTPGQIHRIWLRCRSRHQPRR